MMIDAIQQGGPMMYLLLGCSVVALTVITERLLFWMRIRQAKEPERVAQFLHAAQQGRFAEAYELGHASLDPTLQVLLRGVADRELGASVSMQTYARGQLHRMSQYLPILEMVITWAPLLGILGTITGMIHAFGFLSASGIPDPRLVAAGIAEALVTTAAGLTIAITTLPLYKYFLRRMEREGQVLEEHATSLELILEQRRRIDPVAPVLSP